MQIMENDDIVGIHPFYMGIYQKGRERNEKNDGSAAYCKLDFPSLDQ